MDKKSERRAFRLVGLEETKVRDMREVANEARAREAAAMRSSRVADAALYREVAERAEEVAAREATLQRTLTEDEAVIERRRLERSGHFSRLVAAALVGLALFAILLLATGCASNMPRVTGPDAGTLEAWAGGAVPTSSGSPDLADVGSYPVVGVGGAVGAADGLSGAAGEWWLDFGSIDATDVDAGDLGLFDLEADVVRAGLGLRLGTVRYLGVDCGLGLGVCLTTVDGEASAGTLSRDVHEGGLGAYAAGTLSRGPLFLRAMYIDGPSVEVSGEDVELGGLTIVGGLRWTF